MTAKELRIGNWVLKDGRYRKVEAISIPYHHLLSLRNKVLSEKCQFNEVHPIPLTEEILLNCGFRNEHDEIDGVYYDIYYVPETDYVLEYKLREKVFVFCFDDTSGVGVEITHLHQLQNLYFALTSEELEVKL